MQVWWDWCVSTRLGAVVCGKASFGDYAGMHASQE
jgi:hypothetical protein